ncbi:MAG: hypothetical protein ACRCT8_01675 [Lacipirellulaceae bacterium]
MVGVLRPLFALALLAAQLAPPLAGAASLQDRVDALAQQVSLRYAGDEARRADVRGEIARVLDSWNAVGGASPEAQQAFDAWLTVALDAQMPGGNGRVPAAPEYVSAAPREAIVTVRPLDQRSPTAPTTESRLKVSPAFPTRGPVVANPGVTDPIVTSEAATPAAAGPPRVAEPPRSRWSKHPSAAPLEWTDPFGDDAPPDERGAASRRVLRPTFRADAVSVNLVELAATVRAYNDALKGLNRRAAEADRFAIDELTKLIDELESIEREREFLDLYRGGLAPAELAALPRSPSTDLAWELVRRGVANRRDDPSGDRALSWDRLEERVNASMRKRPTTLAGA